MILHHISASRSFRALWMLKELGLDAAIETYAITDGSLRQPEYLAKAPLGRVPALEVDGLVLTESGAILQYLAETHAQAGFDRPVGHADRARYLEYFGFAETMGSQIEALNLQHLFLRDPSMQSPTLIKLNTARLRATLKVLDAALEGLEYLLPSGVSAADMMMGFNLFAAPYFVKFDEFANLQTYKDRLEQRPAFQRAKARDGEQGFYSQDFYPVPEPKS